MNFLEHMKPAARHSIYKEDGYYVWCGTMAKEGDTYCLLYSRWPRSTGMNGWVICSEVCLATSDSPFGPFKFNRVMLTKEDSDRWDRDCFHNPSLLPYNGKYYLYYMGNHGDGVEYWNHRNNQRVGVAWTDSLLTGTFTRLDKPAIDISEEGHDSLMTSNPAATVGRDGKIVMIYKAVSKYGVMPKGGDVVCGTAIADKPEGPFVKSKEPIMTNPENSWSVEDPFIWYSKQDDKYYSIVKDFHGYFTGTNKSSVALFSSENGLDNFKLEENPLAFLREIHWEDGEVQQVRNLERPQIYFENDKPVALCCACAIDDEWSETFNIQIPLDFE